MIPTDPSKVLILPMNAKVQYISLNEKTIPINELRIGNWIYVCYTQPIKVVIEKVFLIDAEKDIINCHTPYGRNEAKYSLQPIPLTSEILEKCGFEKRQEYNGLAFKKNNFELWKGSNWEFFNYSVVTRNEDGINEPDIDVKYLHQLQNLYLALTGKELEITL
jgi:hypothetical protein